MASVTIQEAQARLPELIHCLTRMALPLGT